MQKEYLEAKKVGYAERFPLGKIHPFLNKVIICLHVDEKAPLQFVLYLCSILTEKIDISRLRLYRTGFLGK